jgi:hypothetical protein
VCAWPRLLDYAMQSPGKRRGRSRRSLRQINRWRAGDWECSLLAAIAREHRLRFKVFLPASLSQRLEQVKWTSELEIADTSEVLALLTQRSEQVAPVASYREVKPLKTGQSPDPMGRGLGKGHLSFEQAGAGVRTRRQRCSRRHAEEEIVAVLRQVKAGVRVDDVCRKVGISQATHYLWNGSIPR